MLPFCRLQLCASCEAGFLISSPRNQALAPSDVDVAIRFFASVRGTYQRRARRHRGSVHPAEVPPVPARREMSLPVESVARSTPSDRRNPIQAIQRPAACSPPIHLCSPAAISLLYPHDMFGMPPLARPPALLSGQVGLGFLAALSQSHVMGLLQSSCVPRHWPAPKLCPSRVLPHPSRELPISQPPFGLYRTIIRPSSETLRGGNLLNISIAKALDLASHGAPFLLPRSLPVP